jgi:membrane-associated phospholipid phosphatase
MNLLHSRTRLDGRVTIALVASYVVDWIVLICTAVIGAILSNITPNKRPFSLTNAENSFPYVVDEKISTVLLVVLSLFFPAITIAIICLVFVPGPTVSKSTPTALIWRRRLWEWHTGWLGLGLSCAAAFLITNGMKNLFGKPRPDLLFRCIPDIANIANYTVGGFPDALEGYNIVSAAICKQTDTSILDDGFRSFPSGHSSFSAAGLVYLSLFLASKLAINIPFLAPSSYTGDESRHAAFHSPTNSHELQDLSASSPSKLRSSGHEQFRDASGHDTLIRARNQAAAPPLYLLVVAIIPFFLSIYISSTRYSDFRHHGFDILFGYFIGTVTAVLAFRLYHLPINRGAGWAWGPRSKDRSFWAGIGVGSYAATNANRTTGDVEVGTNIRSRTNEVGVVSNRPATAV